MQLVRRVSTGLWAGDGRQNVPAARARIARERSDSSKSRVPTGLSDIDGVVGRIRVTRVPTGFWPLPTSEEREEIRKLRKAGVPQLVGIWGEFQSRLPCKQAGSWSPEATNL